MWNAWVLELPYRFTSEIDRCKKIAKENNFEYTPQSDPKWLQENGVADDIEQIKEYYKEEIADPDRKFFIHLTPVWQEKENAGKGGGWRWHKWGKYIGKLNPQCEYLDDEDFGDDFKYVITFTIQLLK